LLFLVKTERLKERAGEHVARDGKRKNTISTKFQERNKEKCTNIK
jgi:hypothetical protein